MDEVISETRQKKFPGSRLEKRRTIDNTEQTNRNPIFQGTHSLVKLHRSLEEAEKDIL